MTRPTLAAPPSGAAPRHSHRSRRRPASSRWPAGVVALLALATGLFGALHYPIAPYAAVSIFAMLSVLAFRFPMGWLVLLFALIPIVGFAPWTGWITFEETDLLVLAAAAGGFGRLAFRAQTVAATAQRERGGGSAIVWLLIMLFALSTIVAMLRGFADAGGFRFGWFQGYFEPMNGVRLAKSLAFAALLLPLWRSANSDEPERAPQSLWDGLMLGLAAVSLATLWERLAFVGLLNFSADYRATALFWEMHVGGGAIDGFLALTMPFALLALL
ncbi:MAG: hypothetical protein ABI589_14190, partial [Burkholderiales bacterium]